MKYTIAVLASLFCVLGFAPASANSTASSRVAQSWHGFYGGAHVGISQSTYQNTISTPASKFDVNVTPLSGGLFGGFNWQMNQIVLGAEVDVSLTEVKKDALIANVLYQNNTTFYYSGRARLGYALDSLMIYGTAGLASTKFDFKGNAYKDSSIPIGWVAGAGAELKLTDALFLRGEYLFTDYGTKKFDLGTQHATSNLTMNIIRAGVGVKF